MIELGAEELAKLAIVASGTMVAAAVLTSEPVEGSRLGTTGRAGALGVLAALAEEPPPPPPEPTPPEPPTLMESGVPAETGGADEAPLVVLELFPELEEVLVLEELRFALLGLGVEGGEIPAPALTLPPAEALPAAPIEAPPLLPAPPPDEVVAAAPPLDAP